MTDSTSVVPFGKYKGQPVEALASDKEYTDWLMAQSWFRDRYSGLYTIIINNFKPAEDSPDHNALQARFLDKRFCIATAYALGFEKRVLKSVKGAIDGKISSLDKRLSELIKTSERVEERITLQKVMKTIMDNDPTLIEEMKVLLERKPPEIPRSKVAYGNSNYYYAQSVYSAVTWYSGHFTADLRDDNKKKEFAPLLERLRKIEPKLPIKRPHTFPAFNFKELASEADYQKLLDERDNLHQEIWSLREEIADLKAIDFKTVVTSTTCSRIEFEVRGWDITFEVSASTDNYSLYCTDHIVGELKPSLGDDYPSVLRQMKANSVRQHLDMYWRILIIGEFTATGATLEQVKAIFAASRFRVLLVSDIEQELNVD